jgi:hypothetical protein
VTIFANPIGQPDGSFSTFTEWVNKATSWIGGRNALCVDVIGRKCSCGADFMKARDQNTFPVSFYFGQGGETSAQHVRSQRAARKALGWKWLA